MGAVRWDKSMVGWKFDFLKFWSCSHGRMVVGGSVLIMFNVWDQLSSQDMSQPKSWEEAANSNDIEVLYILLKQNPCLLEEFEAIPFVDTPLHLAAACGSTHFAIEVLTMKPSLGIKLNTDGLSPMHVALRSGNEQTVRRLMDSNSQLIRVKGRESCTPLHYVAEIGDTVLLALFFEANPNAIEDLNVRKETAVHVAVRSGNLDAFKLLLGWIKYTEKVKILSLKDENDNAALHIAIATNNYEMVRLLIPIVKLNEQNQDGLTALDIAKGLPNDVPNARKMQKRLLIHGAKTSAQLPQWQRGRLPNHLALMKSFFLQMHLQVVSLMSSLDNLSAETRSNLFVVAGLIIAATYQAVLSPPGGVMSRGDLSSSSSNDASVLSAPPKNIVSYYPGRVNMSENLFALFIIFNTLPFLASTGMMIILLPKSKYFYYYSLPLVALSVSYGLSVGIISPNPTYVHPSTTPVIGGIGSGSITLLLVLFRFLVIGRLTP